MYCSNKRQVKNTSRRKPRNLERNCLNFSNEHTLTTQNCWKPGNHHQTNSLNFTFLERCIFEHFGGDYYKSRETESYRTILIALLFQRVQQCNEYAAWAMCRTSFEVFMFIHLAFPIQLVLTATMIYVTACITKTACSNPRRKLFCNFIPRNNETNYLGNQPSQKPQLVRLIRTLSVN